VVDLLRTIGGRLDDVYINRWSVVLGVDTALERARSEARDH
jgi:hypothetical protein